jgi:hypothetical protein
MEGYLIQDESCFATKNSWLVIWVSGFGGGLYFRVLWELSKTQENDIELNPDVQPYHWCRQMRFPSIHMEFLTKELHWLLLGHWSTWTMLLHQPMVCSIDQYSRKRRLYKIYCRLSRIKQGSYQTSMFYASHLCHAWMYALCAWWHIKPEPCTVRNPRANTLSKDCTKY